MARRLFCAWWRRLTFCRQACFCGVTRGAALCASWATPTRATRTRMVRRVRSRTLRSECRTAGLR
eukprot:scaffold19295_cov54-Phaeocystis_antarctica.AAC.1